jgi:hypothetical protein
MNQTVEAILAETDQRRDNPAGEVAGRLYRAALRDIYAGIAMQGMLAAWPSATVRPLDFHAAAAGAYRYADAMLAQREKLAASPTPEMK